MEESEKRQIGSWARDFGIVLHAGDLEALGLFVEELYSWNRKMNLTGLSSREGIVKDLLLDSLLSCPHLPEKGTLLDVGSGAGFPGLPIKVCRPRLKVHLMEANAKRTAFLRHAIRLLKLSGIEVIRGRIEKDGGLLNPEGYHVITARAKERRFGFMQ